MHTPIQSLNFSVRSPLTATSRAACYQKDCHGLSFRRPPLRNPRADTPVSAIANYTESPEHALALTRRQTCLTFLAAVCCNGFLDTAHPPEAQAALLQFPAQTLKNSYFLVRAGESEAETDGYVLTNPVSKTSMTSGLSREGKRQVVKGTVESLRDMGVCDDSCWFWPSITQRAYETASIAASLLGVGQSRIVPEYSFLDPRGLGALEGLRIPAALDRVIVGDATSPGWRPSPGTDGTPNESVADVLVRMRQLLSVTETQYSGANIVVVSPDSDNLSVLQAALLGHDLRSHTDFAFAPGEVRVALLSDKTYDASPMTLACPRPPNCN